MLPSNLSIHTFDNTQTSIHTYPSSYTSMHAYMHIFHPPFTPSEFTCCLSVSPFFAFIFASPVRHLYRCYSCFLFYILAVITTARLRSLRLLDRGLNNYKGWTFIFGNLSSCHSFLSHLFAKLLLRSSCANHGGDVFRKRISGGHLFTFPD